MFGDTPQDVCSSLGAPSKVFFKAEDKVRCYVAPLGQLLYLYRIACSRLKSGPL